MLIPLAVLFVVAAVVYSDEVSVGHDGYRNPVCNLPPQQTLVSAPDGSYGCEIYFSEWGTYYDAENDQCERHMIRGPSASIRCPGPSANNFADEQECLFHCQDGCSQPMDAGGCENLVHRFFYNSSSGQCEKFDYAGCGGNRNNFEHLEDCENICQVETKSVVTDESTACDHYDCNWHEWIHYLVLGCVPIKEHGACCPSHFKCNSTESIGIETSNETGCLYKGKQYSEGSIINMPEFCQVCRCSVEFHGPGSLSCEPLNCNVENMKEQLSKGCVPVYIKNQCCPHSWQCPIEETTYRQKGPILFHKEPEEKHCVYAGLQYPRPYELMIPGGSCRHCTCLTPPYFTCRETVCPPAPSNSTLRCKHKLVGVGQSQCCPEYECWNILEEPDHVGLPKTEAERNACDRNPCVSGYTRCQLNYTQCYLGECTKSCEICAVPMCRFSPPITPPYGCMTCGPSPQTPEEACAKNGWCDEAACVVNETSCRNGYCQPMCRLSQYAKIFFRFNADQVITIPERCTSMTCHADCSRAYDETGCPIACICPDTAEKACQYFTCSRGNQCTGKCSEEKCSPTCPDEPVI